MHPLWQQRDFLKLWMGQTVSALGSQITRAGIPWVAVLFLDANSRQMGLLACLGGLSTLFFGLFAGVCVDRVRRRPILILADLGRALLLASIPLEAHFGRMTMQQLYLVAGLAGTMTVFFDVAYLSYLPSLIRNDQLTEGNSKLALSESIAEVAGPGITGALVQALTAPVAILFDSLSFICSAMAIWRIRQNEPTPAPAQHPDFRTELTAGLLAVAQHPLLRAIAGQIATAGFFAGFANALYMLYAIRSLGITPLVLGMVIAAGGASNLLGAFLAGSLARRLGLGVTLIGSVLLIGLASFLVPLAHGAACTAIGFLVAAQLSDLAWPIFNINELSLRQSITPNHLLGRVNSVMQLLFHGFLPLGSLAGGALAGVVGIRMTLTLGAAGILSSGLWLVFSPVRKLRLTPPDGSLTQ